MAVTGTPSNHYKYSRMKGDIRLKAQLHEVSLAFNETDATVTSASSFSDAGFEIGDRVVISGTATPAREGPFIIQDITGAGTVLWLVLENGLTTPAFGADSSETVTIGTYMVKVLLVRGSVGAIPFTFNPDDHATLLNLKAITGAITIDTDIATSAITRTSGGSFITDGFVVGNKIVLANAGAANGTYTAASVGAATITVNEVIPADTAGSSDETLTADDELGTGSGYTQDTKLTGLVTLDESDANNRCDGTFPTVAWTAAGGSIGPTPGAILYDDASPDDTIIGYIDFDGDQTATDTTNFSIASGTIRGA